MVCSLLLQCGGENACNMTLIQRWKQTALHNKALVLTSFLVAFGTIFYAGAAVVQICILKESSETTSAQNSKLIQQADRMATAMETSIDRSKAALDASIDSFHLDQRAWLGATEVATPTELHEGTILNPTISIVNSGKTPALNVVQRAGYRIVKSGDLFDPAHEVNACHPFRQGVIQPGARRMLSIGAFGAISRQRATELSSGEYRLYLFGEITYNDVFDFAT